MGRKIQKSRRHKKIKSVDPFYTGERKKLIDRKFHLANEKPENVEDQEYPRKLKEIMEAKILAENYIKRKRKRKKRIDQDLYDFFGKDEPGMVRPLKPVPQLKKSAKESIEHFMHRVSTVTNAVIEKTKMEEKFGIDVIEKPGGKIEVKKKEQLTFEVPQKLSVAEKKPRTSEKAAKRREKEKLKKQKILENKRDDFEVLKDEVKFGEVVKAPPTLRFKPRTSNAVSSKPGKRSLLLKRLLPHERNQSLIFPSSSATSTDLTVKRKMLSVSDRRLLEEERKKMVAAYRSAKKTAKGDSGEN